jgi:hypothetical protein
LFDNTNYNSIQPNSYIAFANYSFIPFPKLDVTSNIVYDFMPVFNGITTNSNTGVPAVFPVSLLFESQDTPGAMSNFDTNLFKASLMPEADVLYNYQQSNNKETPYKTDDFKNNPNNKM